MDKSLNNKFDDFWYATRSTQVDDDIEGLDEDPSGDIVDFDDMSDDLAV